MAGRNLTRRSVIGGAGATLSAALASAGLHSSSGAEVVDHSLRMRELAAEFAVAMTAHFGDQFDALIMPNGSFWLKGKHVSLNPDAEIEAAFSAWSAAYDALADNEDNRADDRLYEELRAAEQACVKLSPQTARGVAIQFVVFTAFGEFEATKSADHDFEATMLRMAHVSPPRGLADSDSVTDLLDRLAALPARTAL
jgi:hypothetical protein